MKSVTPTGDVAPRAVDELLAKAGEELEHGLVPARFFNDPLVYRLELDRIFARSWVFIGLEDEVRQPGDYHARRIGEDPFIFCRDEAGELHVMFNSCRHRGSAVCRSDAGNTSHFRCPYHGWTYANDGRLVGVPSQKTAYRELDLSDWRLLEARVATYRGLVFACVDPAAPSLEEYLGDFRWYLDIQLALTTGGMEVVGAPHRWRVAADWKSGAENFCGDSSHTQMTHRSVLQTGLTDAVAAGAPGTSHGLHINECSGHAISIRRREEGAQHFFGYPEEMHELFAGSNLTADQLDLAARSVVNDGTVFPNFSFIHFSGKPDSNGEESGYLAIRVWQPTGPGQMEIWNWVLVPKESSEEYRRQAYRAAMSTFSPSGNFEQDDVTVWAGVASTAGSAFARQRDIRFNYQMGMPGMSEVAPLEDWPGPGIAWPSNAGESGLRSFHRSWLLAMTRSE